LHRSNLRKDAGNMCYHVINRGNNRAEVFHKGQDFLHFTKMMARQILIISDSL